MAVESCKIRGWEVGNFAEAILEEKNGVYANTQMTAYFWASDRVICNITESDSGTVFDNLEDEYDISLELLAEISKEELAKYFKDYCVGEFISL